VAAQLAPVVPHPRLLWPAGGEEAVRRRIAADPLWQDTYQAIQLSTDRMLAQPTVEYRKEGRRLLAQSRRALGLVVHLAFLHRMTGDPRYRDRAVRELRAAAAFPDWNPSHFLDTAEMTLAFAIGYDWLHGALTADERALIRTAIEQKGLAPVSGCAEPARLGARRQQLEPGLPRRHGGRRARAAGGESDPRWRSCLPRPGRPARRDEGL
jgi:hypothetical protein